ncbi:MAG TPA: PaaI family thioesterase [Syntrophomonadaceae bacterium]|nr:PaaI family thioesterase [Syntrophomonadaceae bacterium]
MERYTDIEALRARFPIPTANCKETMQPEFVEYVEGESLTYNYPVLEIYSNPRKSMQGGFIGAAFDNTFGGLVILSTGRYEIATVDLCVSYHCPIFENDVMMVRVNMKSLGKTIAYLTGEAFDSRGRLIASATTNIMLLEKENFHKKTIEENNQDESVKR